MAVMAIRRSAGFGDGARNSGGAGKASPGATGGRCVLEGFDGRGGPPELGGKVGLTMQ